MIDPISSGSPAVSDRAATPGSASSGLSADFETFLRMLTVQAQNQDPLNPIDSTEYAAQLAQFSMVEQQVQTNTLLSGGAGATGGQLFAMANWVGLEARVDRPAQFDGQPVDLGVSVSAGADEAILVVRNPLGSVVARQPIQIGESRVQWDGRDDQGAVLPPGRYLFEVESRRGDETVASVPAEVYGRIVEAEMRDGSIALIFEDGTTAASDLVTSLRQPR